MVDLYTSVSKCMNETGLIDLPTHEAGKKPSTTSCFRPRELNSAATLSLFVSLNISPLKFLSRVEFSASKPRKESQTITFLSGQQLERCKAPPPLYEPTSRMLPRGSLSLHNFHRLAKRAVSSIVRSATSRTEAWKTGSPSTSRRAGSMGLIMGKTP